LCRRCHKRRLQHQCSRLYGRACGGKIQLWCAGHGGIRFAWRTADVDDEHSWGVGQLTTYVFQGGGCGDLLDLDADDSFLTENSSEVRGSVFPIIGTLDAHTAVYINYNSSQGWALIPNANSSFRTQEINGASFSGISFALANNTRVSGVVTATLTIPTSPGIDAINGQSFYTISGCSDSSVNGVGLVPIVNVIGTGMEPIVLRQRQEP
jgi:hypothetical protein